MLQGAERSHIVSVLGLILLVSTPVVGRRPSYESDAETAAAHAEQEALLEKARELYSETGNSSAVSASWLDCAEAILAQFSADASKPFHRASPFQTSLATLNTLALQIMTSEGSKKKPWESSFGTLLGKSAKQDPVRMLTAISINAIYRELNVLRNDFMQLTARLHMKLSDDERGPDPSLKHSTSRFSPLNNMALSMKAFGRGSLRTLAIPFYLLAQLGQERTLGDGSPFQDLIEVLAGDTDYDDFFGRDVGERRAKAFYGEELMAQSEDNGESWIVAETLALKTDMIAHLEGDNGLLALIDPLGQALINAWDHCQASGKYDRTVRSYTREDIPTLRNFQTRLFPLNARIQEMLTEHMQDEGNQYIGKYFVAMGG
mmetsp:Transcript_3128/g.7047  ORF Transcript_3128/g.7047 Transcript_3128/m.7047 type:complete len:375 (+) Transcript_3128:132-1256(+)